MFEQLRLANFQCHESLIIDLRNPVTVITGPSDIGKSAVIRGLRWACQNRPAGDALRKHGAKTVRIGLAVDGHKITRAKGKANTYKLDGQTYAAVGTGVPDPVSRLLRVDDINFAGQHDAAFWFSLTPGQVSRELNRIVNLDAIDRVMGTLLAAKRKAATAEEISEERLKAAKARQMALGAAPAVAKALGRVQRLEAAAADTAGRRDALRALLGQAVAAADKYKRLAGAAAAAEGLGALRERAAASRERVAALRRLIDDVRAARGAATAADESRRRCEDELDKLTGGRCPLCGNKLKGVES